MILAVDELQQAIDANPFPEAEADPKSLHLFFFASTPPTPDWGRLESLKLESEQFRASDRLLYLHAPAGIGRSKLAANVEKASGVDVTARNWRSANKILSLALDVAM